MTEKELQRAESEGLYIKMYDKYKHGEIDKKTYNTFLVDLLYYFIESRITKKSRWMFAEHDDLFQQGCLAIIEHSEEYNAHKSRPTSFFANYIDEFTKKAIDQKGLSPYYVGMAVKLERVAKEYGFEGCMDPDLTPDTLATLSECSLKSVLETLKLKSNTVCSLEAISENMEIEDRACKNPETVYIEKEASEFVEEQLGKCTPLEKFILEQTVLADGGGMSYKALIKILNTSEAHTMFPKELPKKVEQKFVEQKLHHSLRRIKYNPAMRKAYADYSRNETTDQASVEDITAAFDDGMFAVM